jgi:pyruvate/2-oxoglutarate/acetoin dehydrogenase E1 component
MLATGLGAELAARITEETFDVLEGPVLRVANPDVPVPFAPSLENRAIPQVSDVVDAVLKAVA